MRYRVELAPSALADAEAIFLWIAADSPDRAADWFNGLFDRMEALKLAPRRHRLAPESDLFEREIRQMVYGRYRVLYAIDGSTVQILHVRHAARRPLDPGA
jgi:plasmid stabilization system protein ParE